MKRFAFRWILLLITPTLYADVVISEIMYHPVERPAFDANGDPQLDLSGDVHEYLELHNTGTGSVNLLNWRLDGGVNFHFASPILLTNNAYVVVARDAARLKIVYGLTDQQVTGNYSGRLGNKSDAVRLLDPSGAVVDRVAYQSTFPWAIGANALGAEDAWTGLVSSNYQYRGRSLERVSMIEPGTDPANWLASSLLGGPTPSAANGVNRITPLPVVTEKMVRQDSNGSNVVLNLEPVRIEVAFSLPGSVVSNVVAEYYLEDINATNEPVLTASMSLVGTSTNRVAVVLPGQNEGQVVRWRIRADRGEGDEIVSPRADDPFAWHGYFVSPVRAGPKPTYDFFVSNTSLAVLANNITQSPRRIENPDPPGLPRVAWSAEEPAIIVHEGVVYDAQVRYHGSRYSRRADRNSWKWKFPRYARLNGAQGVFQTDKGFQHDHGPLIYEAAELPVWRTRYVDVYINGGAALQRLEQEEFDDEVMDRWAEEQADRYPGTKKETSGETYKSTGVVPFETATGVGTAPSYEASGEGPYYIGNGAPIPDRLPHWSSRERYVYTYRLQMNKWKGASEFEPMIDGLWAARGDSPTSPNPNLSQLRTWLNAHFDVDATLKYIALRNWSSPFDNATHNHFFWRGSDGRWGLLPWDLDGEFANTGRSIYWDEQLVPQPDTLRGPHWVKDSFLKAFREEYKETLFILNNTILRADRLNAMGATSLSGFAGNRRTAVNNQLALGPWFAPQTPLHLAPTPGAVVLDGTLLETAPYVHDAPFPTPFHAATTWWIREANGGYDAPVWRKRSESNRTQVAIPFSKLRFGETYFWKCVFEDGDGHPSEDSVETSFTFGIGNGLAPVGIRLNEILANGIHQPDAIELFNADTHAVDLTGWRLSDDPFDLEKFVFPAGSVLESGQWTNVMVDITRGFALDKDGQTVLLVDDVGTLIDAVLFGPQAEGWSIGRVGPEGRWRLGPPTLGVTNQTATPGATSGLLINEVMASSSAGPDWFELHNPDPLPVSMGDLWLSDDAELLTKSRLPELSFIAGGGHLRLDADGDPDAIDFRLSINGDAVYLTDTKGVTMIDELAFGVQSTDISLGRWPDGGVQFRPFPGSATPGSPNHLLLGELEISELIPDIELRNLQSSSNDYSGFFISDDFHDLEKYQLPTGSTVTGNGFLVIRGEDLPFTFDLVHGGEIFVSNGPFVVSRGYGPSDGASMGLIQTSTGRDFVSLAQSSFGLTNTLPSVGPLVLSEIHYHPDAPFDDTAHEFVEVMNTSTQSVNASGWQITGEIGFAFSDTTVIAPGERVLIVADLSVFNHAYAVPPGTQVLGAFFGKLDNGGGQVTLSRLGTNGTHVIVEKVAYHDGESWPLAADGAGPSLQRVPASTYGNDPVAWLADAPAPGGPQRANQVPMINIVQPSEGALFGAGDTVEIEAAAMDLDGGVRTVAFFANDDLIGLVTNAPYIMTWTGEPDETSIHAQVWDDRLISAESAQVMIDFTNAVPQVAVTAPRAQSHFAWPTNVIIAADAMDPDGMIQVVQFFAGETYLGEDADTPFRLDWSPSTAGLYFLRAEAVDAFGARGVSDWVSVAVSRFENVAYEVPTGTVGNQSYGGGLGMDFEVHAPVTVLEMGMFDSGSDGVTGPVVSQIFRRAPTAQLLAEETFDAASPGVLRDGTGSRFKVLATPLDLAPGSYTVASYGYGSNDRNGNIGAGNAKVWTVNGGGGALSFVGGGRFGGSPGVLPPSNDGGPADRYAAGTFVYRTEDADGDGMSYDFEVQYEFNPAIPDGFGDTDSDGLLDYEEAVAGTDPLDPGSRFEITSVAWLTNATTRLRFLARPGRSYVLQRSSLPEGPWIDVLSIPDQGAEVEVVRDVIALPQTGYWRAKIE